MEGSVLRITDTPALLRDQALERLREAIISGHFPPGTRLIERELCEQMGVSRTSIREVLRGLEAEHLITVEPRRGPIVARLTRKQIAEIYDVRAMLESAVIRIFTEKASDAEIAHLRTLYENLYATRHSGNVVAIARAATEFIGYAMKVADHELISDLQRKLIARVSVVRAISISQPGRLTEAEGELAAVMEAIEKREADKAAQYFASHIRHAGRAALSRVDMGPLPTHVSMDEPSGS
jgi:GntR family transcriptional regulator, trigonelline degradation regulator